MSKEPLSWQRSWWRLGLVALALLIVGSLVFGLSRGRRALKRNACERTLRCLWCAMYSYTSDFGGRYPPHLGALVEAGYMGTTRPLTCCAVHHSKEDFYRKGNIPEGDDWSDYAYVNWSNCFDKPGKVPPDYPLMYDRALSNHDGRGINVLRVDGTTLWDPGGTWLRDFAARHPEYDVPVPE